MGPAAAAGARARPGRVEVRPRVCGKRAGPAAALTRPRALAASANGAQASGGEASGTGRLFAALGLHKGKPAPAGPAAAGAPLPAGAAPTDALFLRRTLRNGGVIDHPGSVIILGDVNRDSQVLAGENIIVIGRLRGEARAGRAALNLGGSAGAAGPAAAAGAAPLPPGQSSAIIFALDMQPSFLQIGNQIAVFEKDLIPPGYPEVARCADGGAGAIAIEPASPDLAGASGMMVAGGPGAGRTGPAAGRAAGRAPPPGWSAWSPAQRAAAFTGAYILAVGAATLAAPRTCFGLLFDVSTVDPGWIRVLGVLAISFGMYYLGAAWGDSRGAGARGFYAATVAGRGFIFLAFAALVAARAVEPTLLVLALANGLGAGFMAKALGQQQR